MKQLTSLLILAIFGISSGVVLRCAEFEIDPLYNGRACTLHNVAVKEHAYDWTQINQTEIHFVNATISFISSGLQQRVEQLEVLNLTDVSLKFLDRDDFQRGKTLRHLIMRNNLLVTLSSGVFERLAVLELLDISNNQIRHIDADVFRGLTGLKKLLLENNQIKEIGAQFKGLQSLNYLSLNYNAIDQVQLDAFNTLTHIEDILLRGNKLDILNIETCNEDLQYIDVTSNSVTSIKIQLKAGCNNTSNALILGAAHNRIIDLTIDEGVHLQGLDLQFNNLAAFKEWNFRNLIRINLANNEIAELRLELLKNFVKLEYLNAQMNQIKEIEGNFSETLPSLKWIGLSGNPMICDDQKHLSETLLLQNITTDVAMCESSSTTELPETTTKKHKRMDPIQIIKDFVEKYASYLVLVLIGLIFLLLMIIFSCIQKCKTHNEDDYKGKRRSIMYPI